MLALRSKSGFTLIEVLVSLLILLVVMLGLLYTLNLGINTNMQNVLRDQAIKIAQGEVNTIISNSANSITVQNYTKTIAVSVNGFQETYNVAVSGQQQINNGINNLIVYTVTVTWNYNGQTEYYKDTTAVHL